MKVVTFYIKPTATLKQLSMSVVTSYIHPTSTSKQLIIHFVTFGLYIHSKTNNNGNMRCDMSYLAHIFTAKQVITTP